MNPHPSFALLDLPPDATPEQARQAYRDLVSVWHPDRYAHNPRLRKKAEEKVKAINAAYAEVVSLLSAGPGGHVGGRTRSREGPAHTVRKKASTPAPQTGASDAKEPAVDWRRTEARLSSLKQARDRAEERNRHQAKQEAEARARDAAARAEKNRRAAEAARKNRRDRRRTAEQGAGEAETRRRRQWAQTEARLQAMLNNRPSASKNADARPVMRPSRFWGYLIQWVLYTGALTACFSVNIIQHIYRFDIFAICGFCLAAILVCRFLLTRPPLRKYTAPKGR